MSCTINEKKTASTSAKFYLSYVCSSQYAEIHYLAEDGPDNDFICIHPILSGLWYPWPIISHVDRKLDSTGMFVTIECDIDVEQL